MKLKILRSIIVEGQVKRPGDIVEVSDLTKNLLLGQHDAEVAGEKPAPAKPETATAREGETAAGSKADGKKKD